MPQSPFGLAYGLGQALSGLPQAMNQRQNEELGLQMRKLQLQQMQRQEREQSGLEQAGMNVKPEMETVTALANPNPEFQFSEATPEAQESARGLGLPVPTAIPNAPTESQMAALQRPMGMVRREKVYTTPYQAAAYRYGQMADYLFKQGMVEPAMRLQQQAQESSKMHQATTISQAARAASLGSYGDATRLLNGLGMNVTGIATSPDDPTAVRIQSVQNGQPVIADVPQRFLGAMIEDPIRGAQAISTLEWRTGAIESREKIAAAKLASVEKEKELDRQSRERARSIMGNNATTAMIRNAAYYAKTMGVSLEEATRIFTPHARDDQFTLGQRASAMRQLNSMLMKKYGGMAPDSNSSDPSEKEDAATFKSNMDELKEMTAKKASTAPVKKAQPESPKANYEGEISPTGKYIFKNGAWVENK